VQQAGAHVVALAEAADLAPRGWARQAWQTCGRREPCHVLRPARIRGWGRPADLVAARGRQQRSRHPQAWSEPDRPNGGRW